MSKKDFIGSWRIVEMELWDAEFIDAEVPGFIKFTKDGLGEFQFGYVHGWIDCRFVKRDEKDAVEFSWEGNDESDPACGRGWMVLEDNRLRGRIFFHQGDDSAFEAVRQ